jgi:hypothetical protein
MSMSEDNRFFLRLMAAYPTADTILHCVRRDGRFLGKLQEGMPITIAQAYEIAIAAAEQNGLALEFIRPENFSKSQYLAIVMVAIKQNAAAVEFVDCESAMEHLCQAAAAAAE